jgi:hypothetical protein
VGGHNESMRVSDAERETTLKILGDHTAAGRLTLEELEDRCDQALTVLTRGELSALTRDLPEDTEPGSSAATALAALHPPVRRSVAIMGGSNRRGPFRAVGSFTAIAVMGGDNIDLREALIEGDELTIKVFSVLGAVNIYVPDSAEVELSGFSILGGGSEKGVYRRRSAKGPVIRVRGFNILGRTTVFRVPPQARALELGEARHLSVMAGHPHAPTASSARRHPHHGTRPHHGAARRRH